MPPKIGYAVKTRKLSGALAGGAILAALLVATGASASTSTAGSTKLPTGSVQVRLITGDVVNVTTNPAGRQTADVVSAHRHGPAGVFQTFDLGSHLYVVPESAAPYLGSTLDPALFDVTELARHPQSSLLVHLSLRSGAGAVSVPGVALHRISAARADGSLTASSARTFGLALASQALRDHASPTHTTGLFRSVTRISPAIRSAAPAAAMPAATHTVTVKATDYNGAPDNGDSVNLYNVDDLNLFANGLTFMNGQAQATVPDGHYSVIGFFYDFNTGKIYETAIPQFTVSKDTTVRIKALDATSPVSVTTPKPADPTIMSVGLGRTDALGASSSYSFLAGSTNQFYAAPTTKKPSVGQFHYYVYSRLYSPASAKRAYTYDVKYPNEGTIKADQSYLVKAGSLATIKSDYPADHKNQLSLDGRFAALPWEQFLVSSDLQFTAPMSRTEYYSSGNDVQWEAFDYSVYTPDPFTLLGEIDTSWTTYKAGDVSSQSFRGQPTHPRLLEHALFENETVCPVCATASSLDVLAFPFGDNSATHRSYPDSPTAGLTESTAWSVKADGKVRQSGTGLFQSTTALAAGAKAYALTYNETRSSSDFLMSTDVKTAWTVKTSAPQADLPDGWVCSPSGDTDCTVLPVMTNDYQLPVNLLGQINSGDATGTVNIGHLADANIKVSKLTANVSFDGGSTWTVATVTGGTNGQFTIAFTVPAKSQTDGFGALQIKATDAKGGMLRQTILKAFSVK